MYLCTLVVPTDVIRNLVITRYVLLVIPTDILHNLVIPKDILHNYVISYIH